MVMPEQKGSETADEKLLGHGDTIENDFSDLDTGWAWVVLLASFGTSCLLGATQYASGIVHLILLERFQAGVSVTSVVGAVHTSLIGLGGPISSFIVDRFSCRVAIVTSGVLFVIGCLGTAFAPSIEFVILTRGVIAGLGGAIGYTANMVVVGFYFRRRRNLAMGLSNSGIGVGIGLLAPSMQNISEFYGPVGFSIILAGIFAQLVVFGMTSFPSKLELCAQRQRRGEQISANNVTTCFVFRRYVHVLKNKSLICLCVGMFSYCLGIFVVYLYLPSYIISKGFSAGEAAYIVSLSGIVTVFGRVATAVIANINCVSENLLYCIPMFIVGVATLIYPLTSFAFAGNLTYSVVLGSLFGNVYMLTPSVSLKYIELVNLSMALGLLYLFGGIGTLLGPVLAGVLVDVGGTYEHAFYVSAACMLLAGVFSATATCFSRTSDLDTGTTVKVIDSSATKEAKVICSSL